jgi:protein-S-isoprenylcysteine O-methyltransferase Ste14
MRYHWSELIFLIGFVLYVAIRGKFVRRSKSVVTEKSLVDRIERVLLSLVFLGCIVLPIVYYLTPLLSFANYNLPLIAVLCGTLSLLAGLWLFWRSHVDLGDWWSASLEIRKGHQLITRGVYQRIRHPMYAAILLFSVAQGLLLHNWLAGWSAVVAFLVLYAIRVPREERMMRGEFGQTYDEYCRRTGRLLPNIL